jgi:putative addiction module component (TIGR02574 family)
MDMPFEEIAADAMKLSVKNRVRLAQRLISSLDEETEADVERVWLTEAECRLQEFRTGKVQGVDGASAFKKARRALTR